MVHLKLTIKIGKHKTSELPYIFEILKTWINTSADGDSSIEQISEAHNLGLVVDSNMYFETNVFQLTKNCLYRLKVLYQIRPYLNTNRC